ncbi:hypothetical protein D9611_004582 [Ephemerocybe angulata]|uniref:Uncharacterized protein n=1 Tax=Ephemerocybe angulata TaxID=980116 RepID=A0A8H5BMM7_9AGAR|nr:hypothetical protein D9611_004582 [Tulosesus angulatus]
MYTGNNQPPALSYGDRRGTTPLSSTTIAEAVDRSPDGGLTLVLSKLNLSDVSVEAAEELASVGRNGPDEECIIERITLGSNRLTTLPTEFALLSRLRYLNLKHNSFSSFPDVLTVMPNLDTLDISHNKIKRFPAHPGRLTELRVFSFSKNKISRLPPYFSKFKRLELLKLDRNPLEWPPRNVLQSDTSHDGEEAMKDWITNVLEWIDYNTSPLKANDDSGYGETPEWESSAKQGKHKAWRFPLHETDGDSATGRLSHNRTFSVDSQASSLQDESLSEIDPARARGPGHFKLALDYPTISVPEHSPIRPSETYLSSPADSEKFELLSSGSHNDAADVNRHPAVHLRASSVATEHRNQPSAVSAKQSLPDLRSPQWTKLTDSPEQTFTDFIASQPEQTFHTQGRQPSASSVDVKPELKISSATRATPSMAFERNSYFQRLSTMPTSVKLPAPLLCLVETARSILFVTSQVYQTIEHYANHAIDQKYSATFKRVLEPANSDMLQLIRALDRFDAASQKSLPPPPVCRTIAETCRNTIVVSSRAVGMFAIQLRMAPCDDPRYSRWILLELYASTAEISVAWQNLLPHMEALKSFLHGKAHHQPLSLLQAPAFGTSFSQSNQRTELQYPPPRLRNADFAAIRSHNARRHAGSFSYRDVELGKVLPSIDEPPSLPAGAGQLATLRTPKRQATAPPTAPSLGSSLSLPAPYTPASTSYRSESFSRHSREPSLDQPLRSAPTAGVKLKSLDLPSAIRQKPDRETLLSIRQTMESSPKVWDAIEDAITPSDTTAKEIIRKAREICRKLSLGLRNVMESDKSSDVHLGENAQLLTKFVTQISNLVKNGTISRTALPTLQAHLTRLAESAEELSKMFNTSSAPSSSARPFSPMFSNPFSSMGSDDNRLGSSLSRTRSAQPTPSLKTLPSFLHESPRSALPSSSFKIPSIHRIVSSREIHTDLADPG